MSRKIDNRTYLGYLLQSLNVDDLKQICRDFQIKGFSRFTKVKLIEFILDSIAEEEMSELLNQKELEIVSKSIEVAFDKINGNDRESISGIKIVNPKEHEVELTFKGFNWEVTSYLSITDKNIDNPERDCDCRIGSNMGLCNHFWVGVISSLKQDYFKLKDWTLTVLPKDFEKKVESIVSTTQSVKEENGQSIEYMKLVGEESDDLQFSDLVNKSITVYEGEITAMEKKQQDFQGNITIYYIVSLKKVKIGPRIQKKSDFKEEDIKIIDNLNIRISEKLHDENDLKKGVKLSANGKLMKDNFLKMFIVKNIRKIEIL